MEFKTRLKDLNDENEILSFKQFLIDYEKDITIKYFDCWIKLKEMIERFSNKDESALLLLISKFYYTEWNDILKNSVIMKLTLIQKSNYDRILKKTMDSKKKRFSKKKFI